MPPVCPTRARPCTVGVMGMDALLPDLIYIDRFGVHWMPPQVVMASAHGAPSSMVCHETRKEGPFRPTASEW